MATSVTGAQPTGDTNLSPSNDLTLSNQSSQSTPTRFFLFTQEWLDLQNYVQQALVVPITQGDFVTKYGSFSDQGLINNAISALADVRSAAATFGDPTALKRNISQDGNYLFTPNPPAEIYAHIVWLANQVGGAASTFDYTFQNLSAILGPSAGTPAERADNLRQILVGPGGLASTASDMQQKTAALLQKMSAFDLRITAANTNVQTYVGQGSQVLAAANQSIGSLQDDITNTLQPAANEALKLWRDYTISAASTSIGVMVLSAGLLFPLAVGLGAGLGVAAQKQKDIYNDLMAKIATENQEIQKKTLLVSDLQGFNTSIAAVAPALTTFKQSLEAVEGVWMDIGGKLAYITSNYGVDQLSSLPWVTQAFKIGDAQKKWQDIGAATSQFTQNSLVTYDFSTQWGRTIPA